MWRDNDSLNELSGTMQRRAAVAVLVTLLAVLVLPVNALAQDESSDISEFTLEQLMGAEMTTIFGASRYAQDVSEAPSSVTIISADEIRSYGWRTLAEVMRAVRGFSSTYDRAYHYVGARGFGRPGDYNTRLLLLIDGRRTNEAVYGSSAFGTEFLLDIDMVDRVEIIRGPASSLYGSSAFFGVVNVVTRRGSDLEGGEAAVEFFDKETLRSRFSWGQRTSSGVDVQLSATYYERAGSEALYFAEFDDPESNDGMAMHLDNDRAKNLFGRIAYGNFSLETSQVYREKAIPTGSWGTVFNDPRNQLQDDTTFAEFRFEQALTDVQPGIFASVQYIGYSFLGGYPYDWAEEDDEEPYILLNQDVVSSKALGSEFKYTTRAGGSHVVTVGGELFRNFEQDQSNFDEDVYLDDSRSSTTWGVYAQDEFRLSDSWIVNAGVRYDEYASFGGTLNPRAALIFNPDSRLTLKGLYGRAFRAPSAYELYYNDGDESFKAPTQLDPEVIETWELVAERYMGQHMRATASLFTYKVSGLISLITDPADDLFVFTNLDEANATGVEAQLEGRWNEIDGRFSYTYQNVEDGDGLWLSNSPRHMAKFHGRVPVVSEKLHAAAELLYTSERGTVWGDMSSGFLLGNLTLRSPNLLPGLDASLSMYNALDNAYGDPGSEEHEQAIIMQDGRTFRIKLIYGF